MSTNRTNGRIQNKKVIHSFIFFAVKNIVHMFFLRDN